MKKENINRNCLLVSLELALVKFIVLTFSLLFTVQLQAQTDTINVLSDIPPGEGNLNLAVNAAIIAGSLSNSVFKLELNGYYILNGTITVPAGELLTIIADEPGQTQDTAPPQIVWSSGIDVWNSNFQFIFDCFGDITLKNIWLLYANTKGDQVGLSLQIEDDPAANESGKGEVAVFENVIFDYSACPRNSSGAVGVTAKHFKGTFKNCYFKNCVDSHFRYYGRAVSFPFNSKGWHTDSLSFENCSFANIGYVLEQEWEDYSDYVKFNHCTFFNVMMFPLESGWWNKLSVTNSIFVNTQMFGDIPAQSSFDGGEPYGGTIIIDSVASFGFAVPFIDQDRRILFTNSSYYIEEWLSDWMYENPGSIEKRNSNEFDLVPVPQPMLNTNTLKFFNSIDATGNKIFPFMNKAHLYDSTNPGFIRPLSDTVKIKSFLHSKWWDSSDWNWAWKPENSFNRLWPPEENLAYTNATLLTAGMNGFPLGDLYRWFPEQYKQWKLQEETEIKKISCWLNTGVDTVFTSVKEQHGVVDKFELSQNFPNPFNPSTKINYQLPLAGNVSIKVYDLLGREVATVFEGIRQAGMYCDTFNGNGFASGIYFYQMKTDNFMETKKFILLK